MAADVAVIAVVTAVVAETEETEVTEVTEVIGAAIAVVTEVVTAATVAAVATKLDAAGCDWEATSTRWHRCPSAGAIFLFRDPARETTLIRRVLATVLIAPIRFYQLAISPMIGPNCRFTPTCSQYAIESIRKHGAVIGLYRAACRIARCHPWNPGGYDPP